MSFVPVKEDAATIRMLLKAAKMKASVRSETFTGGSAIDIVIDEGSVCEAETIVKRFKRIDRCKTTGEILSGCNRYINVTSSVKRLQHFKQLIEDELIAKDKDLKAGKPVVIDKVEFIKNGDGTYFVMINKKGDTGNWDDLLAAISYAASNLARLT